MESTFRITGMHCSSCVAKVTTALRPLADEVEVTLTPGQAILTNEAPVSLDQVRAAVSKAGNFQVDAG